MYHPLQLSMPSLTSPPNTPHLALLPTRLSIRPGNPLSISSTTSSPERPLPRARHSRWCQGSSSPGRSTRIPGRPHRPEVLRSIASTPTSILSPWKTFATSSRTFAGCFGLSLTVRPLRKPASKHDPLYLLALHRDALLLHQMHA